MKPRPQPRREDGSATLVVLALLLIMAALALGNNRTLHQLHQELDLIEQRQLTDPPVMRQPRTIPPVTVPAPEEAGPEGPTPAATPETEDAPGSAPGPGAQPEG